jgi:phosphopantothenoylcysteine decarboxylase/phosphopantothenate--cysteine ligase
VGTAAELQDAVVAAASVADVVVMAAAVSDYRVSEVADTKLTKEGGDGTLTLRLVENPDVLAGLARARRPGQTIVGFAAETASGDELRERGRRKRERKGADLLVVNRVGWSEGFESEENSALLLREDAETETSGSKREVADAVWDAVLGLR